MADYIKINAPIPTGKSQDYLNGYTEARKRIEQIINQMAQGQQGGMPGMSMPNNPNEPDVDGLDPITPLPGQGGQSQQGQQGESPKNIPIQKDPNDTSDQNSNPSSGNDTAVKNWQKARDNNFKDAQQRQSGSQSSGSQGQQQQGQQQGQGGGGDEEGDQQDQSGQQQGQGGSQSGQNQGQSGQSGSQSGQGQSGQQQGQGSSQGQSGSQSGQGQSGLDGQQGQGGGLFNDDEFERNFDNDGEIKPQGSPEYVSSDKTRKVKGGFVDGNYYDENGNIIDKPIDRSLSSDFYTKEQGDKLEGESGFYNDYKKHVRYSQADWNRKAKELMDNPQIQEQIERMSKQPGMGSLGAVAEYLKARKQKPVHNWQVILKRYLKGMYTEVISKFPKKKHLWRDVYMRYDTAKGESGKDIIYLLDTSGSMGGLIEPCLREINALAESVKVDRAYIIQGDYDITSVDEIRPKHKRKTAKILDIIFSNIRGFGGTSFQNMFNWVDEVFVKKMRKKVHCVILLTDTYDTIPKKPVWADKLIWFVVGDETNFHPPYGKVLFHNLKENARLQ